MSLQLAVKELFEGNEVEVYWNEQNEPVMTIQQLAKSLEYAQVRAVEKLIENNTYLRNEEFSALIEVPYSKGGTQKTRIFNEDGIYEVTMLSKKPKAREFRAFVRKLLKQLRRGEVQLVQPQSEQEKLQVEKMKAEARLMNARTRQAKLILDMQKNNTLSPVAVELLQVNALEVITDKNTDHRPEIEKTYTATEVGNELGITANKIGRIAKANELKTDEYGVWVMDKSRHSSKQVSSFRYNEKGKKEIEKIVKGD
ncbi:BRO-N domain-containing protein [Gracilibacillus lacisalsi]|uniref:BRO-N domain-containing protein n=1 Tax=Gracilibacillus lacisalsi TaxID=393087 RepID=UPI00037B8AF7|nr:Bro-N domain-containing protein [Gracilibacillus lacisalsi]